MKKKKTPNERGKKHSHNNQQQRKRQQRKKIVLCAVCVCEFMCRGEKNENDKWYEVKCEVRQQFYSHVRETWLWKFSHWSRNKGKMKMRRSVVSQHSTVQMFYFRLSFFLSPFVGGVCVFCCFCFCSCLLCFCFHFTWEWRVHFISLPLHLPIPIASHSTTHTSSHTQSLFVSACHVLASLRAKIHSHTQRVWVTMVVCFCVHRLTTSCADTYS